MKLHLLAHSRTGDKGNTSNISVIAYRPEYYEHICRVVTAERVKSYLGALVQGSVIRYEMPSIASLNFVLKGALDGGVTQSLRLDTHGKTLSFALLDMEVEAPGEVTDFAGMQSGEEHVHATPEMHLPKAEDFLLWPPNVQSYGYRNVDKLFASRVVKASDSTRRLQYGKRLSLPRESARAFTDVDNFIDRNSLSGLLVIKDGTVRAEKYALGLTASDRWSTMSTVKSMTGILTGVAVKDGSIGSLDSVVPEFLPAFARSAYEEVRIRDLLTMSSGVEWSEDYSDKYSHVNLYSKSLADKVPGGVFELMKGLRRERRPGTRFHYNTGDTFMLSGVLRSAVGTSISDYMSRMIWQPAGMEFDAFYTLESDDGLEIGGSRSGITLRDLGRFALFVLEGGVIDGRNILPDGWLDETSTCVFTFDDTDRAAMPQIVSGGLKGYGLNWWIAEDGAIVAVGFAGQRIYVNRAERLAIVTLAAFPSAKYVGPGDHDRVAEVVTFTEAVKRALG